MFRIEKLAVRSERRWRGADGFLYYRPGKILPSTKQSAAEEEQRRWCVLALGNPCVPHNVRNAILKALKVPPRRYNKSNQNLRAWIGQQLIRERKAEMKAKGERPRGGRHPAAVEDVADIAGLSPGGLSQLIRRSRKSKR